MIDTLGDGIWIWFTRPISVKYKNSIYATVADNERNINVFEYSIPERQVIETTSAHRWDSSDGYSDHLNAGITVFDDEHIGVSFPDWEGNILFRKSTNSLDVSSFDDEKIIAEWHSGNNDNWSYSQVIKLKDGKIMVFMRDGGTSDGDQWWVESTDNGETWSDPKQLTSFSSHNPYQQYYTDGENIYACFVSAEGGSDNPKYDVHFVYYDGESDSWKTFESGEVSLPVDRSTAELAYDSPSNQYCWNYDIIKDGDDNIRILIADELDTSHIYKEIRYDGVEWSINTIVDSNSTGLLTGQPHYSPGIYFKRDNPDVVYAGIEDEDSGIEEIRMFETDDGENWNMIKEITFGSSDNENNYRPTVPWSYYNESFPVGCVFFTGRYDDLSDYDADTVLYRPYFSRRKSVKGARQTNSKGVRQTV